MPSTGWAWCRPTCGTSRWAAGRDWGLAGVRSELNLGSQPLNHTAAQPAAACLQANAELAVREMLECPGSQLLSFAASDPAPPCLQANAELAVREMLVAFSREQGLPEVGAGGASAARGAPGAGSSCGSGGLPEVGGAWRRLSGRECSSGGRHLAGRPGVPGRVRVWTGSAVPPPPHAHACAQTCAVVCTHALAARPTPRRCPAAARGHRGYRGPDGPDLHCCHMPTIRPCYHTNSVARWAPWLQRTRWMTAPPSAWRSPSTGATARLSSTLKVRAGAGGRPPRGRGTGGGRSAACCAAAGGQPRGLLCHALW